MGRKSNGWNRRKNKFLKILHFWQFQKIVFDYYNYSDHIYTKPESYGVKIKQFLDPAGKEIKDQGEQELKGRSTL